MNSIDFVYEINRAHFWSKGFYVHADAPVFLCFRAIRIQYIFAPLYTLKAYSYSRVDATAEMPLTLTPTCLSLERYLLLPKNQKL